MRTARHRIVWLVACGAVPLLVGACRQLLGIEETSDVSDSARDASDDGNTEGAIVWADADLCPSWGLCDNFDGGLPDGGKWTRLALSDPPCLVAVAPFALGSLDQALVAGIPASDGGGPRATLCGIVSEPLNSTKGPISLGFDVLWAAKASEGGVGGNILEVVLGLATSADGGKCTRTVSLQLSPDGGLSIQARSNACGDPTDTTTTATSARLELRTWAHIELRIAPSGSGSIALKVNRTEAILPFPSSSGPVTPRVQIGYWEYPYPRGGRTLLFDNVFVFSPP